MSSDVFPFTLQQSLATTVFMAVAVLLSTGCSQSDDGKGTDKPGIESEAEARTIVTDNVRLMYPGTLAITPQDAALTPCGNYDKNAIGEGPPWSAQASQSLAGPEQVAEAIRRIDALSEAGYRLRPPSPRGSFPEERIYEDDRGITIGISATELPDSVFFSVFSGAPCVIDKP